MMRLYWPAPYRTPLLPVGAPAEGESGFYPVGSSSGAGITVRGPISGDMLRMQGKGRYAYSRNLTLNKLKGGKELYTFTLTWIALSEDEKNTAKAFFTNNIGQRIDYKDLRNQVWRCIVMTPDMPFVHNGRINYSHSVELLSLEKL